MKKIYLILLSFSFVLNLFSQTIDAAKTQDIVSKYSKQLGLSDNDMKNYIVSSSYKTDGIQYIYLVQTFKGLPVRNQMKVISIMGNDISTNVGNFIPNVPTLTNSASEKPLLNAKDAIIAAFKSEKISLPIITNNFQPNTAKFNFGQLNGVTENVTGELMWYPILNNNKVEAIKLIWAVVVAPNGTDDIWQIILDANNGNVIDKFNLTISETFTPVENSNAKNDNAVHQIYKNYVDNSVEQTASPSIVAGASYLVVPYPAESPVHTGGTAAVRTNPWTAAAGAASALGWHSTGTTDYNITRGNNVWATEGTADVSTTYGNTGNPATSTTGPNPLTFNFTPNYNSNPTSNPFQQFAITNLFYWTNIIHNITYQYGFNEAAGNFQQNNQGLGGNGNDYVIAIAQSAAAGPVGNNANFSTPPDGNRPRMRMYLWNSVVPANVLVNTPSTIGPNFTAVEGGFSNTNTLSITGPVTGQVVYFNDDAAGSTHFACGAPANTITGKIVLIDRGNGGICANPTGVPFTTKVLAAQNAGAIAVIMINNVPGAPIVMGGGPDNTIVIPAVMVSQSDGAILVGQIGNNLNVTLSGGPSIDGDVDNGIIVHEFGHGISNRLTGGGSNTSCLQNAEQGGEGWSDIMSLMLTTDWANVPLTDGVRARPIGTYVNGQSPFTGAGIRAFPYSTNMSVNPLTYANVGTGPNGTQVHYIGTVWCTALWEMTWAIIAQENAINPNLYNFTSTTNGGNSIALKLILEGMKLQPCSPGFIDARDAILAADRNLYNGRHACTIWTAFAKRAMGFSALQGSSTSVADQTTALDMPPAPSISTQPLDISVAAGANATFSANAGSDVNLIYNWQVSTDGGATWNNVSPATITPTLTLNAVTSSMNGFKYRVQVFIGCAITTSSVATLTVTGTPTPSITLTSAAGTNNQTVCINTAINNIVYSTSGGVTGASVTGLPAGVSGTYAAGIFTISGTATASGSFNYTVTTTGAAPAATATGTIIVSPATTLTLSSAAGTTNQTVNVNNAITNITYTTGNGVTGATVTGLPAGVTGTYSGGTNGGVIISGTPTAAGTFNYTVTTTGGCGVQIATGTLTVATTPSLTLTSAAGTNIQTVCVNAAITNIVYSSAGGVTGATVTGLPAGVTGSYSGGVFTISGTPTATGSFSYTVTSSGGTPNATATGTITVSALTTLTLTSAAGTASQTVTVSSSITNITYSTTGGVTGVTVTGLPAGVTGTYSGGTNGTVSISGTPTAAGTFNYTVTTTGGCGVQTATGNITVVNGPSITLTSAAGTSTQSVCVNAAITNIVYTAAGGVTGATITGLPAGVTGTYSGGTNGTFTIAGTPSGTGTFTYNITTTGGTAAATATGTITVNGAVTLTLTSAASTTTQTVNINTAITNISYSTTGGVTGVTVTGLPSGVTGTYSGGTNGTVTIGGTPTVAGTFNYTVTTTGGCSTQSRAGTITVVVPASVTLSSAAGTNAQTICIGNAITAITYTTAGGITGASTTGLPAGVTGTYSGGTNGTYTISGTPTAAGTFNYTITSTGTIATATGSITVNALPAAPMVTSPANYCQGATATALTAPGNNLLWYIAATGGTGSTTAPTPNTATTGNTPYYVSQTINGCESPRATILVTINPTPAAPIVTAAVNYCQGGTATALTATGTGTGLLWYTTSTGGTGTATAPTPSTTTAGTTLYYVSQTTGVCEGPRALITVTVSAGPSITVQPSNITSCTTTATFSVTATGTNLTYQWQVSTDGGITYSNIAGATSSSYTISGLTVAQSNNKYRVAVSAAGCSSVTSGAVTARVGTAPTVVLTAAPAVNFNPATNGGLYITVSPVGNYTYQWKRNNVILPLVTSTSITKANGLLDEFGSYQVTVFDVATGCAGVSNTISVSDIAGERNRLFLSPNPTRGVVKVSYYSSTTAAQGRIISVYDSKGAKIITSTFTVSGNYGSSEVDLSTLSEGTYLFVLRDAAGKIIASDRVIKY